MNLDRDCSGPRGCNPFVQTEPWILFHKHDTFSDWLMPLSISFFVGFIRLMRPGSEESSFAIKHPLLMFGSVVCVLGPLTIAGCVSALSHLKF